MQLEQLIEQLDTRFGNPNCPKQYSLIAEAVVELRRLLVLDQESSTGKAASKRSAG